MEGSIFLYLQYVFGFPLSMKTIRHRRQRLILRAPTEISKMHISLITEQAEVIASRFISCEETKAQFDKDVPLDSYHFPHCSACQCVPRCKSVTSALRRVVSDTLPFATIELPPYAYVAKARC